MIRLKKLRSAPIDPSRALTSDLYVPCPPGLSYDPYQIAGIEYASKRQRTLIGDDPGSGKTIMAVGVSNLFPAIRRVLIVCPGFLKPHWHQEWTKWDVKGLSVGVAEGLTGDFPTTDVVIINFDILRGYTAPLRAIHWDLLIIDEIHKLKSRKADRTRYALGGIKRDKNKRIIERVSPIPFKMVLDLTGTPTLNGKPKELWNIIQQLDPDGLGRDWYTFAKRYCKLQEITRFNPATGKQERIGWIWDECDNLEELQEVMRRRFMVRRLKADIMPQLKPKRRMIVPIAMNRTIKKLLGKEGLDFETAAKDIEDIPPVGFGDHAKAMHAIGMALIDPAREIIEHDLEEYDKIVVMAYHHDVVDRIANYFGTTALKIHDGVPVAKRQALVDQFQNDPKIRLIIGTIGTMGVGFTMTKARLMIFIERVWVPGDVTQAEDRIHRRGQFEQAIIKHLVLENSQSERQVKVLIVKQERSDKMLDKKSEA